MQLRQDIYYWVCAHFQCKVWLKFPTYGWTAIHLPKHEPMICRASPKQQELNAFLSICSNIPTFWLQYDRDPCHSREVERGCPDGEDLAFRKMTLTLSDSTQASNQTHFCMCMHQNIATILHVCVHVWKRHSQYGKSIVENVVKINVNSGAVNPLEPWGYPWASY